MRKIKIAQIGTSYYSHGSQIFDVLKRQSDIFEIAGYAFPENEAEKFPQFKNVFAGYRELTVDEILNDPEIEAVTIECEEIYLTKYATLAAEHGKHIHMEKPGGTSLSDFKRLIETVKRNGTLFHTGYMYRYNPCLNELIRRLNNGDFGRILSIEAQMNWCYHDIDRQWLENFPGGNMFFLGCHLLDFILQIKGVPKSIVPFNISTGTNGITSKDFAMAVLCYDDGNCLIKTAANEIGGRRHFVVAGTEATAVVTSIEGKVTGGLQGRFTEYKKSGTGEYVSPIFNRFDCMIESFSKMIRGEITNPYTYDYELLLYETLLKCCEDRT